MKGIVIAAVASGTALFSAIGSLWLPSQSGAVSDPSTASGGAAIGATGPSAPTARRTLMVRVVDSHTGDPIAGAPVEIVEAPGRLYTTGSDGAVLITKNLPLTATNYTVLASPTDYAPIYSDVYFSAGADFAAVEVPTVPMDIYRTGVIDPAVGGTFSFSGPVTPGSAQMAEFQLVVPPGFYGEPVEIGLSPLNGDMPHLPGELMPVRLMGLSCNLIDSQGQRIEAADFVVRPTLKFRPWVFIPDGALVDAPLDFLSDCRMFRSNYSVGDYEELPSVFSYDAALDMLSVELVGCSTNWANWVLNMSNNGSIYNTAPVNWVLGFEEPTPANPTPGKVGDELDDDGDGQVSIPKFSIGYDIVCSSPLGAPIDCGRVVNAAAGGWSQGQTFSFDAAVESALEAEFGSGKLAKLVAADVKVKAGVSISYSGGFSYEVGRDMLITIPADAAGTASHPLCSDGCVQVVELSKELTVNVLGASAGFTPPVITLPHFATSGYMRWYQPNCSPDCAELSEEDVARSGLNKSSLYGCAPSPACDPNGDGNPGD